ncbi:MAG: nucleotide sugar dehydrogenase [Flavobacteriales bacterium]|nr:nucleotide sugar dehydrogenase [Flavobacteriales bacterium]
MSDLYERLKRKEAKMAVIGLGYVGLPIALAFARKIKVVGFDINAERVEMMRRGEDPSEELSKEAFDGVDIHFTADINDLKEVEFYIVAVPTPIDQQNIPDLTPLLSATRTVGKVLKKGDHVVFESTVYPGCTEEDCVPVLEELSGLTYITDFKVGYSPERINPGDKVHTLENIVKVTSGCDAESAETVAKVYEMVVAAGVHRASSIKVAEAAKIIENTQRDVNIALTNELSIIFNRMGINTFDVLEAAGTKWNFLRFQPGLVGGHCIGVDPYYLVFKAKELGYHAQIIDSGRFVNDSMGGYVAKQTVKKIIATGTNPTDSRVLVMGATFKENVSDIRNSKVADVVKELKSFSVQVDVADPHADSDHVKNEYGYGLVPSVNGPYDAIIVAVNHAEYADYDEQWFRGHLKPNGILVDLKGTYRKSVKDLNYWSL